MKFSINKNEFLNALGIAGKGIASRSTIPILSGVYIKTLGTSLELKGTDSERAIRCTVSALIDEDGECVVPERLLYDIVKSFPDAAITMEVDETQALISCDKTSFTLKVFDPADFPAFPDIDVNTKASICESRIERSRPSRADRGPYHDDSRRHATCGNRLISFGHGRYPLRESDRGIRGSGFGFLHAGSRIPSREGRISRDLP